MFTTLRRCVVFSFFVTLSVVALFSTPASSQAGGGDRVLDPPQVLEAQPAAPPVAPAGADNRPHNLMLWTSCAQQAYIKADNPLGLSKELQTSGPIAVERLIWGPAVDECSEAVGYRMEIALWMPMGIKLKATPKNQEKSILAFDAYPAAVEQYRFAHEYSPAFRSLAAKTPRLWLYYGSADTMEDDPQRWAWSLVPAVEAKAGIIVDALADKWTEKGWKAYQLITAAGLPVAGEPWTGKKTAWSELGLPCFVLYSTAKEVIKDNFSPGWGVEREPPGGVRILIEDHKALTDKQAFALLEKYTLAFPTNTPRERLRLLSRLPPVAPPDPVPPTN